MLGKKGEDTVSIESVDARITEHSEVSVLFFPDPGFPCRSLLRGQECRRENCRYEHQSTSLSKLLSELRSARKSIDVCVFTITCNEIADVLETAAKRGVAVRIITDDMQMRSQGSDVMRLSKVRGVQVRHDGNSEAHMHHKFAIVDGAALLNGSFNWTRAAVLTNKENVVVTKQAPDLIAAFAAEFEKLWGLFVDGRAWG